MEALVSIVIWLGCLAFTILTVRNSKKKQKEQAEKRRFPADPVRTAPPDAEPGYAWEADAEAFADAAQRIFEEIPMGFEDDEGCLGGSMAHDNHEGESRAEHARHLAAIEARERLEAQAPVEPKYTPADLRRAVVMAEILGRPKALERRG